MVSLKLVAFLLNGFIFQSDAAVTLEVISSGTVTENGALECGENGILKCVVSPFPGSAGYMSWTTDSRALTQCFNNGDNDCTSRYVDHYNFTSSVAEETFNLTFNTLKMSDGLVEFRCTDTPTTKNVIVDVKILPNTLTTTLVNTSANTIKVTTGCVYPAADVSFKWMFYAETEVEANAKDYNYGSHSEMTEDSPTCTVGDCGGSDVKRRSSTLELENTEKGGSYNFKVVITHAASSETVTKTIGPFELGASTEDKTSDTDAIVGGTVGGVLGLCCIAAAVVGIRHLYKKKKGRTITLSTVEGGKVTLSCPFPKSVTYPEWRGPPGLTTYTRMNDTSGDINPAAPAFGRLQYASNKRDLILSNAVISDSGDYTCSYTGQGNHTITLKVNRGKGDKASNVVNTGSHPDEKKKQRRPQPPPPFGANSPQREGSGSVVTGRDVEMQETYTPLKRSQSPDIHDGKRRGLSANFTDGHHPLVSIDIPAKRAGALESIPDSAREDVTKKKKKRKRRVETEDDQSD